MVPVPTRVADNGIAWLRAFGFRGQYGPGVMAHRAQCKGSRFSLCDSFYRPTWPLYLAGWVQLADRARRVAPSIFAKPDGWRYRRLSLEHSWRSKPALSPAAPNLAGCGSFFAV